jgi:ferrochelatase
MFADPNILRMPSILRKFVGTMIVLTRTKSAQGHYKLIGNKSPLLGITQNLAKKLEDKTGAKVYIAMRYTPPFAKDAIEQMKSDGITEVFLLPMYPQYSTTTTKSSIEDFIACAIKENFFAKPTHIDRFYENTDYNELIISKLLEAMEGKNLSEYELIFSAHSLPEKIIRAGDSYEREINAHVDIFKSMLVAKNIQFAKVHLAYQSKLGPMKWLDPSLGDKLAEIKTKKALICPIAFTIDNLETVYELDIEYREVAEELGFEDYIVAKCANDNNGFVDVLAEIYKENR